MKSTLYSTILVAGLLLAFSSLSFSQAGTLDSSFGVNGTKLISLDSPHTAVARVTAIQDDGKIVIAGWKYYHHFGYDKQGIALCRLLSNGSPDSSFGINGNVTIDIDSTNDIYIHTIAIQKDGKIILAGTAGDSLADYNDSYLVRYKIRMETL